MATTKKRERGRRPAAERRTRDGRVPYTTTLQPDVRELLEEEAERVHKTRRRTNYVIEELARKHLKGTR